MQHHVDAARERAGCRNEVQLNASAGRSPQDPFHFRRMAMRERLVGEHVGVPGRMVGRRPGSAPRPGTPGHRAHHQAGIDQPGAHQRHGGEQHPGGEASGMADVAGFADGGVLRQQAPEHRHAIRGAVLDPVHGFVGLGVAKAKIGGHVDHAREALPLLKGAEGPVDQLGAGSVGGRREDGAAVAERVGQVVDGSEAQARPHTAQVGKDRFHRLVPVAPRHDRGRPDGRMGSEQAKQFAAHVAGSAEDDGGNRLRHVSPARCGRLRHLRAGRRGSRR